MDVPEYERMFSCEGSHWWFRGIRSLVFRFLRRFSASGADSPLPVRVLDLGCGTGITLDGLSPERWAVGMDISPAALAFCRRRSISRLVRSPAESLPVRSAAFHAVLALDLLEHTGDDRAVIDEIVRVLRPGGVLILTVPAGPGLWSEHDRALGHQRRYRRSELREKLTRPDTEIEKLSYFNFCLFLPILAFRRMGRSLFRPKHTGSDLFRFPGMLNALLTALLKLEARLVGWMNVPFGVSLFAVVRKK